MKVYTSIDMEGITGLVDLTFVHPGERNYYRGQQLMTAEANRVISAAFQSGCKEIIVNDSHSKMTNLLIEELHKEAKLISGDVKPYSMVQGLDHSFDGAIFLGYHACASQKGVMSHTMTSGVKSMFINGKEVGELGLNAYVAGFYGVPVLLVSGDDAAASEAEELIPGVTTAVVKEQQSRSAALCFTPAKTAEILTDKTIEAIHKRSKIKPLAPPKNPVLTIEFTNYGEAEWANLMPGTTLEEGTTSVSFKAKDILEAYQAMLVMTELAVRTSFS
ncbi:M55 family metallopeptidase [Salipaludibacillus aurantiacus]|uniref:D-amino peptidase n=1 Tax=Salipaludibacillus aurantiacus TaxID=1601833 RepID=A0A1H9SJ46_9BACI|nr:M55 family metallopeptidase [Salipaludibacillus aurantiacus]SER85060.1 D-amino peptidase [Salipaludibacillus aurantiacus]